MEQHTARSRLEDWLELPSELWLSWVRLFLAALALLSSAIDRPEEASDALATEIILGAYVALAALLAALEMRRTRTPAPLRYIIHGADILVVSALIYASESATSPFFVFFIFINIAAAIRWGWRGAALTSTLLVGVLLGLIALQPETDGFSSEGGRTLIRSGFLVLSGALLAYLGAYRERRAVQFSRLAEWPPFSLQRDLEGAAFGLAHAAAVVGADRLLIIWAERDEPCHHLLLWTPETTETTRELLPSDVAQALEAPPLSGAPPDALSKFIVERFGASGALSAAFAGPNLSGRVFLLDRVRWSDEHVPLAKIIATRVGLELEEDLLRHRLEQLAGERERSRLGRDLHDGVLQALTAASLHLKAAADRHPQEASSLHAIRDLLTREARRLRRFVEESRDTRGAISDPVRLEPMLRRRAEAAERQWGCRITCDIEASVSCSTSLARHLRHMMSEAVSNAARHGAARHIGVRLATRGDRLVLELADDGSGFPGLSGRYSLKELDAMEAGPHSLCARVRQVSGNLWLETSQRGVTLTIEAPLEAV